ncbi:hypothetical protein TrST_g941 [Triparma strigata]|uniref:histone acetyltransferase n=1 Tax=Triparma strigata TaxID=1606541 RepID=A0A9W7ERU5_9STRA|nr:hypothetical protein TrST_g941 [Triparma strigata]
MEPPQSPTRRNKRRKTRNANAVTLTCQHCRQTSTFDNPDNLKCPGCERVLTNTVKKEEESNNELRILVPQGPLHGAGGAGSPTSTLFTPTSTSFPSPLHPDDPFPQKSGQVNSVLSSTFTPPTFLSHVHSLRLEPVLRQFRGLVQKLMNHSVNKSMFNVPVNPVLLNLPDYTTVIKEPMDLGTVKSRCASFMYSGSSSFSLEVSKTFTNAQRYNPPHHLVHQAATTLLREFQTDYAKLSASPKPTKHSCSTCLGSTCGLCGLGCLKYDLPMIVCSGVCGMRIRKGGWFYVTGDGSMCWCHKCYAGLHSVLPAAVSHRRRCEDESDEESVVEEEDTERPVEEGKVWYKRELLKRKFDDEVAEGWVKCKGCRGRFHQVCALFNSRGVGAGRKTGLPFLCPFCVFPNVANPAADTRSNPGTPKQRSPKSPGSTTSPYNMLKKGINMLNGTDAAPPQTNAAVMSPDSLVLPTTNTALGLKIKDQLLHGPNVIKPAPTAWTLISGRETPICLPTSNHLIPPVPSTFGLSAGVLSTKPADDIQTDFTAESLPKSKLAAFIEDKVREIIRAKSSDVEGIGETVTVREISCLKQATTPNDTIKANFKNVPNKVEYLSRSIMVFQRIDNIDLAIFSMYVQEYEADSSGPQRVYLAYLDSVEYFRPRSMRTDVYHEVVVSYFGWCKAHGFSQVHIWSCPPSRGNNFIFWGHPTSQKTPNRQRLQTWYQALLSRAVSQGIATNVHSLCDDFENYGKLKQDDQPTCPVILHGDYWLDEAARLWKQHEKRVVSNKLSSGRKSNQIIEDKSIDLACMLKSKIMSATSCVPFLTPVDPKKLGILDYFNVIKHPMDLGTVHDCLMKHRYDKLSDANKHIGLVFSNAMTYNPPGHPIHLAALKLQNQYNLELSKMCEKWQSELVGGRRADANGGVVIDFSDVSLKRNIMNIEVQPRKKKTPGQGGAGSRAVSPIMGASHPNDKLAAMAAAQMKSQEKKIEQKERETTDNNIRLLLSAPNPSTVSQLMMGQDYTHVDPSKKGKRGGGNGNKKAKKPEEPPLSLPIPSNVTLAAKSDKSRKSWLAVEVGKSLRKMRSEFFVISLKAVENLQTAQDAQNEMADVFKEYVKGVKGGPKQDVDLHSNPLVDMRHTFLELSQMRHLQFSTLRLAKFSSCILLYYLHRPTANSLAPCCDNCKNVITKTRWHCAKDLAEINLCVECYETLQKQNTKSVFTPFRITFNNNGAKRNSNTTSTSSSSTSG